MQCYVNIVYRVPNHFIRNYCWGFWKVYSKIYLFNFLISNLINCCLLCIYINYGYINFDFIIINTHLDIIELRI